MVDKSLSDSPLTEMEFEESIASLLREAHDTGVEVDGGWVVQNGPTTPDWEVHITEVEKPPE